MPSGVECQMHFCPSTLEHDISMNGSFTRPLCYSINGSFICLDLLAGIGGIQPSIDACDEALLRIVDTSLLIELNFSQR